MSVPARRQSARAALATSIIVAAFLGCGSDEPAPGGAVPGGATAGDSGLPARDAGKPAAPGLDARVVLPIEDPSSPLLPARDGSTGAPGAGRDGGLADASVPRVCENPGNLACKDDEFCSQEDVSSGLGCGLPERGGVCAPRFRACAEASPAVCGCDRKTYGNECEAHEAGVSVSSRGACATGATAQCDDRQITCKRARPTCGEGQVPAVVASCWGECVGIEQCLCKEQGACPEVDKYACHMSAGHCGPYVN